VATPGGRWSDSRPHTTSFPSVAQSPKLKEQVQRGLLPS
jgi:hypothetical protein